MPEEYRGYKKPKGVCDFMGCKSRKITILVSTKRDSGAKDRDLKFCSESHTCAFLILYGSLEEDHWKKEDMPSQKEADEVEGIIEQMMDDYK